MNSSFYRVFSGHKRHTVLGIPRGHWAEAVVVRNISGHGSGAHQVWQPPNWWSPTKAWAYKISRANTWVEILAHKPHHFLMLFYVGVIIQNTFNPS